MRNLIAFIEIIDKSKPNTDIQCMVHNTFNDLVSFFVVAEERSYTKAATKLGVAQSTLSQAIKELEARLGVRLLNRTTRSVMTTDAGEKLLKSLAPKFTEIEAVIASLMEFRDSPTGNIRLTLSEHALESVVWPKLKPVLLQHPDIKVDFSLDSGFRNIVEEGFDAGVRLGESIEKDMIAVRIGPEWRLVAVASPDYWSGRTRPTHPKELTTHRCINLRHSDSSGLAVWEFSKNGQDIRVRVDGQLIFKSSPAMIDAVLSAFGIAYLPEDLVAAYIQKGDLVQVLDDWSPRFPGYFIYYPTRRQNLQAFRIIVDALKYS